ncbi:MAG: sulfite exporter TauE/SafE family protein [Flavobacteriales bacterium]|nr:sulfite exporter TauE/SafE family protein [Flavobacteriales bacterium]
MHFLIAALILGLAGSLHCAGMCGPLISAMPYDRSSRIRFIRSKTFNHLGRIITYSLMGLVMGAIGLSVAMMGFQQGLAIAAGIFVLLFMLLPQRMKLKWMTSNSSRAVVALKKIFSTVIAKRNPGAMFSLGLLHGLLPCGLVYAALAGALATGDMVQGALFMFVFGIGTTPVLVMIGTFARQIKNVVKPQHQQFIRVFALCIALLLIFRGSNLGIPYLSPKASVEKCGVDCCGK